MLQPVRGTHDIYGNEYLKYKFIVDTARYVSELYGFDTIETPIFEFSPVFMSMGETSDVVTKETYTFEDRGGQQITLRPEGTAGAMRAIVSNGLSQHVPLKYFYSGPMFRYERPQKGRYRQFNQIGVELVGVESSKADIEVLAMAHQMINKFKIPGKINLEINTLGDCETRNSYREALVDYLNPFKNDLSEESKERLQKNPLRILDSKNEKDKKIVEGAPSYKNYWNDISKKFFEEVIEGLENLNIPYVFNPKLVRGLDYYCHTAFEFVTDSLGSQGAIIAGGRYDGLIKRMGGNDLPGVGWAGGVERLMMLTEQNIKKQNPVAIVPLGEVAEIHAQLIAQQFRENNIVTDLGYNGNMKKRMKRANKIDAKCAIIFGEDEMKKSLYTVKNLDSGEQIEVDQNNLISSVEQFLD